MYQLEHFTFERFLNTCCGYKKQILFDKKGTAVARRVYKTHALYAELRRMEVAKEWQDTFVQRQSMRRLAVHLPARRDRESKRLCNSVDKSVPAQESK